MDRLVICLKTILNPSGARSGSLSEALSDIDRILNDTDIISDSRLKHFLQNRSYQKALTWIEGGDPEEGICGK